MEQLAGIDLPPLFAGRYNIAPSQRIAIIRQDDPCRAGESIWGFPNPRTGILVINARSESVAERPMFRALATDRRCIIPADGFFEWKTGQPHYFQLHSQSLFGFAGLFREDRCVILTRAADENMHGIHDRMPVILPLPEWKCWLERYRIEEKAPALISRPVSRRVNSVKHDDPSCIAPADQQGELF